VLETVHRWHCFHPIARDQRSVSLDDPTVGRVRLDDSTIRLVEAFRQLRVAMALERTRPVEQMYEQ